MVIEAKLEVRDSASWDTLDRAIDRLGGTSAVHATAAAMEGQAAATAAAAADALSPGESDEEESTGERCITSVSPNNSGVHIYSCCTQQTCQDEHRLTT